MYVKTQHYSKKGIVPYSVSISVSKLHVGLLVVPCVGLLQLSFNIILAGLKEVKDNYHKVMSCSKVGLSQCRKTQHSTF